MLNCPGFCSSSSKSFFPPLQVGGGGHRGGSEHARRPAHRTGAVWRAGPEEMAV